MWYVYHTCAEGLPEKLVSLSEVRGVNHLVAKSAGEAPWFDSEELSDLSLHITNYATDPESALKGPGFLSGTRRYLQHDAPIHLFFEYVAWCRQSDSLSASYSTFTIAQRWSSNGGRDGPSEISHPSDAVFETVAEGIRSPTQASGSRVWSVVSRNIAKAMGERRRPSQGLLHKHRRHRSGDSDCLRPSREPSVRFPCSTRQL